MTSNIHVVGVCGSRRDGSHTKTALEVSLQASDQVGATTTLLDLRTLEIPPLDPDITAPGDVAHLTRVMADADAIILATPMYHGSYSGVLKNAIDHCGFDEFADKTVGLLAVSGGRFPVSSLEHLRTVCRSLNAWVLPYEAAIPESNIAFQEGDLIDNQLAKRVQTLGRRIVEYARITPHQTSFEGDENVGAQ